MINNEQKQKIGDEFNVRIQALTCPICQKKDFYMADGYFSNNLQDNISTFTIEGQSIPTIPIICTNCGFVSQHALGILGLLPKTE